MVKLIDQKTFIDQTEFTQTQYWAQIKKEFQVFFVEFSLQDTDRQVHTGQTVVFVRKVGFGQLAYVPYGPIFPAFAWQDHYSEQQSLNLFSLMKQFSQQLVQALPVSIFLIRYDLHSGVFGQLGENFHRNLIFKKPFIPVEGTQPAHTVLLDLNLDLPDLLSQMKSKTRYNIGLALKKNIQWDMDKTSKYLEQWYHLSEKTAERQNIHLRPLQYYQRLWEVSGEKQYPLLALAWLGDTLIAGHIILIHQNQAIYLFGASDHQYRQYMAPSGLHWMSIEYLKKQGLSSYDFFGIAPGPDKQHPWYGLYTYKTGFGGTIIHRFGGWDYPVHWKYRLFRFAERCRGRGKKTQHKRHSK